MSERPTTAAIITGFFAILAAIVAGVFLIVNTFFSKSLEIPGATPIKSPSAPQQTSNSQIPFSDNFDNDVKPDWQTTGEWRTVNEKYTVTNSSDKWVYSFVGDTEWQDYAVDVDYTLSNSNAIMVIVRAGSENNLGLAYLVTGCDHSWNIWKDGQWSELVRESISCANEGHIRVVVSGSKFIGSPNGATQLTLTDKSTTAGRVGLGINCYRDSNCSSFDNFSITQNP